MQLVRIVLDLHVSFLASSTKLSLVYLFNVFAYSLQIVSTCNLVQGGYGIGSLLVDTVAGWRYMYGASTPLAVIMGIGMWWLPASPRWLLLRAIQGKGNMQELRETAIGCLYRLRGPAFGDSASEEVDEILTELAYVGDEKEATLSEMFKGKCLKALTIGAGLVLFQQVFLVEAIDQN